MNALIQLLAAGIAAYSQILAELHSGAITPEEAEKRIAASHASFAADRSQEDVDFAKHFEDVTPVPKG